jgi:hypothetical protein
MMGKLYKVKVYDSVMDLVHQSGRTIKEIYIPDLDLTFNHDFERNVTYAWRGKRIWKGRTKTIEVRNDLCNRLVRLADEELAIGVMLCDNPEFVYLKKAIE